MTARNSLQTTRELEALYRNGARDATVVGYDGPGDEPRAVQGDLEGPWLKTPPFTDGPTDWQAARPLSVADYEPTTTAIDVRQFRLLTVFLEMAWTAAAEDTAQLSLIPEKVSVGQTNQELWFTTGVVDPTLTLIDPTGATFGDGFGSRAFAPAELRTSVFTGAPRTIRTMLTFDVSDAARFRLQALQNVAAQVNSTLALAYSRSQ